MLSRILLAMLLLVLTASRVVATSTNSVDFDRTSGQYLEISDAAQTGLHLNGDYTFELWVKFGSYVNEAVLVAKRRPLTNERGYSLAVVTVSGPEISAVRFGNSASGTDWGYADVAWNPKPSLGKWYHLAVVVENSAQRMELFVDGVSQGIGTGPWPGILPSTAANSAPFRIGNDDDVNYFDGMIDEVRIWNDKRTADEIQAYMCAALQGNEPNLVGCWDFDLTLLDKTAIYNDLTYVNGATFSTDVPSSCEPVTVEPITWSLVKDLYRK